MGFNSSIDESEPVPVSHTALVHYSTYPLSFGLLAFVFAGHAVFPAIYTSMQKPEEYESMLDKTYGVVMINCLLLMRGYFLLAPCPRR